MLRVNECAFVSHYSISFLFQGELKRSGGREVTPKSLLLKPGQTGLRPPGFSTLPAARLATFGFVRSSSVSSNDRGHADARGHARRESLLTSIYVIVAFLLFFPFKELKSKEISSRSPAVWSEAFSVRSSRRLLFSGTWFPGSDADESFLHKVPARPSEAAHTEDSAAPPDTPSLKRRSLPPQRCSPLGRTAALCSCAACMW